MANFSVRIRISCEETEGVVQPQGGVVQPQGRVVQPQGGVVQPQGRVVQPQGGILRPQQGGNSGAGRATATEPVAGPSRGSGTKAAIKKGERVSSFDCSICLESLQFPAGTEVDSEILEELVITFCKTAEQKKLQTTDLVVTSCGHLFHRICLLMWFLTAKRRAEEDTILLNEGDPHGPHKVRCKLTCPTCKETILAKNPPTRVYLPSDEDKAGAYLRNRDREVTDWKKEHDLLKSIYESLSRDYEKMKIEKRKLEEEVEDLKRASVEVERELSKKNAHIRMLHSPLKRAAAVCELSPEEVEEESNKRSMFSFFSTEKK